MHKFEPKLDYESLMLGVSQFKAGEKKEGALNIAWTGGCALMLFQQKKPPVPVGSAGEAESVNVAAMSTDELVDAIEAEIPAKGTVAAAGSSFVSGLLMKLLQAFLAKFMEEMTK